MLGKYSECWNYTPDTSRAMHLNGTQTWLSAGMNSLLKDASK